MEVIAYREVILWVLIYSVSISLALIILFVRMGRAEKALKEHADKQHEVNSTIKDILEDGL